MYRISRYPFFVKIRPCATSFGVEIHWIDMFPSCFSECNFSLIWTEQGLSLYGGVIQQNALNLVKSD